MKIARWRVAAVVTVVSCVLAGLAATPMASASGSTLYVAIGGSDTGNCQVQATPCATITYAASQASTGDTIDVGPGTFVASVGNAIGVLLTVQGSSSGSAPVTTVEPTTPGGTVFSSGRGGWTLDDLTIDGLTGDALVSGYAGTMNVVDSTITDSDVALCGCGPVGGTVSLDDSTVSGNTFAANTMSGTGGVDITASTLAGNDVGLEGLGASYSIAGSILSGNNAKAYSGKDCSFSSGTATDAGYNLDDDGTCGFAAINNSLSGVNPDLGSLQDNGGPTETMAPAADSPALDQIPSGATGNSLTLCPGYDQRGVSRPQGSACDMGAVEIGISPPTTTASQDCTADASCTATETVPATLTQAAQEVSVVAQTSSGNSEMLNVASAPGVLGCRSPKHFQLDSDVLSYSANFVPTANVAVTDVIVGATSTRGVKVCFQSSSSPAYVSLKKCARRSPTAPCFKASVVADGVQVEILARPNDPRFHCTLGATTIENPKSVAAHGVVNHPLTIKGTELLGPSGTTQPVVTFSGGYPAPTILSATSRKIEIVSHVAVTAYLDLTWSNDEIMVTVSPISITG